MEKVEMKCPECGANLIGRDAMYRTMRVYREYLGIEQKNATQFPSNLPKVIWEGLVA